MQETFFTVNETALALRVHVNTVRKWLMLGKLTGKKAGKKWLITQRAIDALIEAQSANGN
jgi:excisionase family DNA binding protein